MKKPMPKPTKPKIPTITRHPSWPSWARWYAVDSNGDRHVYQQLPGRPFFGFWQVGRSDRYQRVGARPRYLTKAFANSLRRIVPAKARK